MIELTQEQALTLEKQQAPLQIVDPRTRESTSSSGRTSTISPATPSGAAKDRSGMTRPTVTSSGSPHEPGRRCRGELALWRPVGNENAPGGRCPLRFPHGPTRNAK